MKRIIDDVSGKRIRVYCNCDKGHKWIGRNGVSPTGLKGKCRSHIPCQKCEMFMWTYSK